MDGYMNVSLVVLITQLQVRPSLQMTHLEDPQEDWQISQAPVTSLNALLQQT